MGRAVRVYLLSIGLMALQVGAVPANTTITPSETPQVTKPIPYQTKPTQPGKPPASTPIKPIPLIAPIINVRHSFELPTVMPMHRFEGKNLEQKSETSRSSEHGRIEIEDLEPDSRRLTMHSKCGGDYEGLTGTVTSPNFPYSYAANLNCKYNIRVPNGYQIGLICNEFSLQPGGKLCQYDYLQIDFTTQERQIVKPRFCGTQNIAVVSDSNVIEMVFHTDEANDYKGFECVYRAMINGTTASFEPINEGPKPPDSPDLCAGQSTGDNTWSGLCGVENFPTKRIVGGEEMFPHQSPWMTAVLKQCDGIQYCMICGGTIISEEWILTGAHCIEDYDASQLAVLMGDHNLYTLTPSQKFMKIAQTFKHPEFNIPTPLNNDVGILKLAQPLVFSRYFAPVCLPDPENNVIFPTADELVGEEVVIMGWGTTEDGGYPSPMLRKISVPIIENDECDYYYGLMTPTMICTAGDDGKGPCQGDSGGPAIMPIYEDSDRKMQVGTMSFGASIGCDDGYPSGQASIFKFMGWIKFITGQKFLF